jgi:hypothetical protein
VDDIDDLLLNSHFPQNVAETLCREMSQMLVFVKKHDMKYAVESDYITSDLLEEVLE